MSRGPGPARFLLSAMERKQWPTPGLPEVAFAGRSNVGKSSCLNTLVGQRGAARVSKTPGRTQAINFFEVRRGGVAMHLADLPGYGFAKVPLSVKAGWEKMVGGYLAEREGLSLVVLLVDLRRDPTDLDQQMIRWLADRGVPGVLVLTKSDKVPKNRRFSQQAAVCRGLGVPLETSMLFSSLAREGIAELWGRIDEAVRPLPERD